MSETKKKVDSLDFLCLDGGAYGKLDFSFRIITKIA